MKNDRIAIVDGVRTPFAKSFTAFRDVPSYELGRVAVRELLARTELDPELVDELIIGNVAGPPEAVNVARVIALLAYLPKETPAYTIGRNCASGFEAITSAVEKIQNGVGEVVIAGGAESMTQIPLFFRRETAHLFVELAKAKGFLERLRVMARFRPRHFKPIVGLELGLTDYLTRMSTGDTAELLAKEFHIVREEQDQFALESHRKAAEAIESGRLAQEIVAVYPPPGYPPVAEDVGPRKQQTLKDLARLRPIFDRKNGTVTAGNSCMVTDGAVGVLLMKESRARALGLDILGTIRSYAFAGLEPERMGLGPAVATPLALRRAGLTLKDMGLIEINEAFSAQVIAVLRAFKDKHFAEARWGGKEAVGEIDPDRLNVNGGAIALGHPVGASGTRLVLTLLLEMKRRGIRFGLATLCVGGGQGGAIILER